MCGDGEAHFDGVGRRDVVSEVSGVEVGLQATDGEDELGTLDLLPDLGTRDRSDIDLQIQHRLD